MNDLYANLLHHDILLQLPLMEAIAHCHHHGIAHRDIKPDNILFNNYNELKLADFGSAECFGNGGLMSGIVGTPYYVAPEVLAGRDYNETVDVWSAGVILYIMLAGIPPFYGESAQEIFEAVLRANLRFPRKLFSSVSAEAKDLLRRMLCKDVSRRFSAHQVLSKHINQLITSCFLCFGRYYAALVVLCMLQLLFLNKPKALLIEMHNLGSFFFHKYISMNVILN